jgi:hypothetical protein
MMGLMTDDDRPSDVLGTDEAAALDPAPVEPASTPGSSDSGTRSSSHVPTETHASPERRDILGTAVAAAGELAQLGATLGVRALKEAWSRLPRP